MHRVGAPPEAIVRLAELVHAEPLLSLDGDVDPLRGRRRARRSRSPPLQLERFDAAVAAVERAGIPVPMRHAANSAAAIAHPASRYDLVRCGIAVYGIAPAPALGRPAGPGAGGAARHRGGVREAARGRGAGVVRPAARRRARHHGRHPPDRVRRRRAPPARPRGPGGADRGPPPPDDRRRHHGPGARRRRPGQRRARSATRWCCSARRAGSASRRTSGPPGSAPSPTRWCARSAQGSSAGTEAPRLLRRDRGRHHRLRRRDARPGRRGVVAGSARAT